MPELTLFEAWTTVPKIGRYDRKSADLTVWDCVVYVTRAQAVHAAKHSWGERVAKKIRVVEMNDRR